MDATRTIIRAPRLRRAVAAAALVAAVAGACGSSPGAPRTAGTTATEPPVIEPGDGGVYAPAIDPANFTDVVDNPYFPLLPGARWEYESVGSEEAEHTTVVVTGDRRLVMGVSTIVVRDTVTAEGELVEDTFDWYAQDRDGDVWYFGEAVRNFDQGRFESTDGSWEAGVDGALPGIVMPAEPTAGHAYRQEYYPGQAEDLGQILHVDQHETVPFGDFAHVVVTRDWNPLEPEVVEEKSYAPAVGLVSELTVAGGTEAAELVSFTPGSTT
jgi:hypothetical protein